MWREHTLYRRSVRCARSRKGYTISLLPLYRAIAYSYPEGDATVISKTFSPKPGYVRVIFELPVSLWAHRVYLVADFNGWDPTAMPFKQERAGVWRLVVDLPIGHRYEFRYLIDGRWVTDYHADGFTANCYHTDNSVVDTTLPVAHHSITFDSDQVHESRHRSVPFFTKKKSHHDKTVLDGELIPSRL